jgi:hypothetical protein
MIKLGYLVIFATIALAFAMCATGCSGLVESTKEKQINFDSQVYGFKVVMIDPSTGSISPTGEMGFGSINYRSMPVEKGQPFYARYTVKSLWSNQPASDTTIWVGRASDKGTLTFEAVPDTMILIGADGIRTGTAELKINSEVK